MVQTEMAMSGLSFRKALVGTDWAQKTVISPSRTSISSTEGFSQPTDRQLLAKSTWGVWLESQLYI